MNGARTDIGCLDHAHVVPAVPNAADALLREAPDKSGDVCFLRRRALARDDNRELRRDLYELIFEQAKLQKREQDKHVTR
jgi:pyruvate/2-oxoglutarate/acetoin dehydrogenase E1 component